MWQRVFSWLSSAVRVQMLADVSPLIIEHFRQEEVIIDITEHELVPEHVVLSAEEKAALGGAAAGQGGGLQPGKGRGKRASQTPAGESPPGGS